jgi:hypothetical protein
MFALLPPADAGCANTDRDGVAVAQVPLQGRGPRLTGNEVPAIDEYCQVTLAQSPSQSLDRFLVGTAVTQEDVESGHPRPLVIRILLLWRIRTRQTTVPPPLVLLISTPMRQAV